MVTIFRTLFTSRGGQILLVVLVTGGIAGGLLIRSLTGSNSSTPPTVGGVQGLTTTAPASFAPSPTAAGTGTAATPAPTNQSGATPAPTSGASSGGSSSGGGSTGGSGSSGTPACAPSDLTLHEALDRSAYEVGTVVSLTTTLTNASSRACTLTDSLSGTVQSGGSNVFSNSSPATGDSVWQPGSSRQATFQWQPGLATGSYTAVAGESAHGLHASLAFSVNPCGVWDFNLNDATISASPYRQNQAVNVDAKITNISGHECQDVYDVSVKVTDSSGNVVFGQGNGAANSGTAWNAGDTKSNPFTWTPAKQGSYTVEAYQNQGATKTWTISVGP